MKIFHDYLGLSNSCSYDVDDVISRADRFGFQNFCSPALDCLVAKLVTILSKSISCLKMDFHQG